MDHAFVAFRQVRYRFTHGRKSNTGDRQKQYATQCMPRRRHRMLVGVAPRRRLALVPRRRGFRGLGDCSSPVNTYGGVPYCRDNATGSLVPCAGCGCASGPAPSNTPGFIPMGAPTFATMPFGSSTTTTFTLASYIAEQMQAFTGQSTLSLANQGITPATMGAQLMALAQQYCAVENPPDCGQINSIVAAAMAHLTAAFQNVPSSQWSPATFTDYAGGGTPGIVTSPGPQIQPPAGGGGSSSAPSNPPTVAMRNLTRPGSDTQYQVGDSWQITITGKPGAAVTGSASQGAQNLGTTAFGNLNGAGQMVLTGTMTAAQVGTWVEGWTVAGNPPSTTITFTVAAAPAGAPAGTGAGSGTGSGVPAGSAAPAGITLPGGFTLPDLSSIPSWV